MTEARTQEQQRWETIYEKYSGIMYSIILRLIPEESIAEQILKSAFLSLKTKNIISVHHLVLCSPILKYTYTYTLSELKNRDIVPKTENLSGDAVLNMLFTGQFPAIEKDNETTMSEAEKKRKIRTEFKTYLETVS